ncbi:MAG: hypothetical protein GY791_10720 [Alphaproteobacteria bacterium]|nr:hypothetical protein [Alphaproteobacteria bacterium]
MTSSIFSAAVARRRVLQAFAALTLVAISPVSRPARSDGALVVVDGWILRREDIDRTTL